jgi:Mg-chelatase subunit ChlD
VAAVGSAAVFERAELARATRVEFRAGRERRLVATSQALLAPPGWPSSAGAHAASPHLVYALDAQPDGVSVLAPAASVMPSAGTRVRVVGLSEQTGEPEERPGRVLAEAPGQLEIELDRPGDPSGWAGAPVLLADGGGLIGTLEQAASDGASRRVRADPIGPLVAALARPLEHGAGRSFARFAAPAFAMAPPGAKLIRPSEPRTTRIQLEVSVPQDASAVAPAACGVFVSGRARALVGGLRGFDVAIVIDTSLSTSEPTGADVNGNGIIGKPDLGRVGSLFEASAVDPGDSILAAEVAAARSLLRALDPRNTRVALITFAGQIEPPAARYLLFGSDAEPAVTLEPLTRKFGRIERALDDLLETEPDGVTHMAAGVDHATRELLGLPGARSKPDPRREKVMLFLTDGQPTLPFGPGKDAENVRAVLDAAGRAAEGGIRVHTFAIGPEALAGPIATVELAARTQGYFIPVREPGDLVDVVEALPLPDLRDVVVRSATTGAAANPFYVDDQGFFSALVAADVGENRIEIVARADDGTAARREIAVRVDPDAPPMAIPEELAAVRNARLEECLAEMRDQRLRAEREQAERVRRELLVEIEREREKARARAAEQRKELRLEVENP